MRWSSEIAIRFTEGHPNWCLDEMSESRIKIELAMQHLERVQTAWFEPTDWTELSIFGFYCLENAIDPAAEHFGIPIAPNHFKRVERAEILASVHGLADVGELLVQLNIARKNAAYGDTELPDLDAEVLASSIEEFVDSVEALIPQEDEE